MKRVLLIGVAAATILSGCGLLRKAVDTMLDPSKPAVAVVDGKIEVRPDPLVFEPDAVNVIITWTLPTESALTFSREGIVFEGKQDEIVRCALGEDPKVFTCLNRHTKPGEYKYTVRLLDGGKPLAPLDPTVRNR